MKRIPMLIVAALLGAAVSVPAQSNDRGRAGRQHRGPNAVVASQPAPRAPVQVRGSRATRGPVQVQGSRVHDRTPARRGGGRADFRRSGPDRGHGHDRGYDNRRGPFRGRGRWVDRCEQVLVPGYWDERCVPATYGWIYSGCGHRHWGIVRPAYTERVWVPARYENRTRRVWVRH